MRYNQKQNTEVVIATPAKAGGSNPATKSLNDGIASASGLAMTSVLPPLMFFRKKALGIDIHDNVIQVVLLEKRGKEIKLIAFNQGYLPANIIKSGTVNDQEQLTGIIRELLKTANPQPIKPGIKTICAIPEMQIFVHLFEFPRRLQKNEIEKAIPFEAEKIVPFPIEQTYWDTQEVSEIEEKAQKLTTNVIYAAVPKELADSYFQILDDCDIPPATFALETSGLVHSLIDTERKDQDGILILDLGSTITTLTIYDNHSIQNIINIALNGKQLFQKIGKKLHISAEEAEDLHKNQALKPKQSLRAIEPSLKKLSEQINQTIKNYNENNPTKIKKIILCGACLDIPGIVLYFMQNLSVHAEIGNPWQKIKITPKNFVPLPTNTELAHTKAVSFATAIGLAIRGISPRSKQENINLVPEKVKQTESQKRVKHMATLLGVVFIIATAINMFSFAVVFGKFYFEKRTLETESKNIIQITTSTRYNELKTAISEFNTEVAKLEKIQTQIFSPNQIITEVLDHIPDKIQITGIEFDHQKLIIGLSGIAPRREDIQITQSKLAESLYITEIYSPLKNFDKRTNVSFEFTLSLNKQAIPLYGGKPDNLSSD